jgi:hypothetical protein
MLTPPTNEYTMKVKKIFIQCNDACILRNYEDNTFLLLIKRSNRSKIPIFRVRNKLYIPQHTEIYYIANKYREKIESKILVFYLIASKMQNTSFGGFTDEFQKVNNVTHLSLLITS